jgi:UDP-glucose 4-epimerase
VEVVRLALQAIVISAQPGRQVGDPELQEERPVGNQASDRAEVQLEDAIEPEPATDALVGDGGVEVAVADDPRAARERRADHLVHVLGARGRVQERLGPGGNVPPVENEVANALPELRSSGFAREDDVQSVRGEALGEERRLRGLSGPVDALERHEHRGHPTAVRRMRPVRVIVTGGAGFIGSHVVDALLARGDEVAVVDSLVHGKRDNVSGAAELHVRDVREPLDDLFDAVSPEAVLHLAAQADVRVSVEEPVLDAEVNVLGTVRILEGARRHRAQVVFSSTGGAIYGECEEPARETSPCEPISPYGTAKLAGEEYLRSYNRLYDTRHVALRYGNVYGPRQDPQGEAGVVAIFLGLLASGEHATIFGDGLQTRDYVYVGDVARATLTSIGHDGGVFNVGTGRETSVVDLYALCARVVGSDAEAHHAAARLGELQRSFLDPGLAERELGFQAMVELEDGLRATWEWVVEDVKE